MTGRAFPAEMAKKGARPPVGTKSAADWYWKRYTELYPKYFWADDTKLANLVVASAKGPLRYAVEGKEYIDLTSQWATTTLGNVHPEILKATVDALERYGFLILFMNPHLPMIDVAERLLSIRPSDTLTRVFLELSGTGAAEGAVKHAIEASGRPLILSFMGQYHGLSIGATAFGTLASRMRRNWEAFSGGAIHAPYPMTYRKPKGMTDEEFGEWCLGFLEDQILRYVAYPDRIAGVIFEPVALEAGVWIPPKNFVRGLRKLADAHGWFFIADEVEAGLGRTGKMWGIEHFGVAPDLVSIGKALGGGLMPLGAVLGDDRSMGKGDVVAGNTIGGDAGGWVGARVTHEINRGGRISPGAAPGRGGAPGGLEGLGELRAHSLFHVDPKLPKEREERFRVEVLRRELALLADRAVRKEKRPCGCARSREVGGRGGSESLRRLAVPEHRVDGVQDAVSVLLAGHLDQDRRVAIDAPGEVCRFRQGAEQGSSRVRASGRPRFEEVQVAEQLQGLDGRRVEGELEVDIADAFPNEPRKGVDLLVVHGVHGKGSDP